MGHSKSVSGNGPGAPLSAIASLKNVRSDARANIIWRPAEEESCQCSDVRPSQTLQDLARFAPLRFQSTIRILKRMTTPVPTRFSNEELALIDDLVEQGVGDSRSAVIRQGVHHLADTVQRARIGADIAASYRDQPQTSEDDDLAMANAIAMTEAEPW